MLIGFSTTETSGMTATHDDTAIGLWLNPYNEPNMAAYQIASGAGAITVSGGWTASIASATSAVEYRAAAEEPPWEPEVDADELLRTVATPLRPS